MDTGKEVEAQRVKVTIRILTAIRWQKVSQTQSLHCVCECNPRRNDKDGELFRKTKPQWNVKKKTKSLLGRKCLKHREGYSIACIWHVVGEGLPGLLKTWLHPQRVPVSTINNTQLFFPAFPSHTFEEIFLFAFALSLKI